MDINEISDEAIHRHPWELSRTDCVLREVLRLTKDGCRTLIDLGAGDQFFDDAFLTALPECAAYAVDLGYTPEIAEKLKTRVRCADRIGMSRRLEASGAAEADLALMMDSLEYMEDDAACLRELAARVRPGGYVVLTVPAFNLLFSSFDRSVRGSRRYNKKELAAVLARVDSLEPYYMHYFYTSLFIVRFIQKFSGMNIDPQHKVISGWPYGRKAFATRIVKGALDLDYRINTLLGKAHLDLPGLSLFAVCKKSGEKQREGA